jgi:DNA polymerase III delta subunit
VYYLHGDEDVLKDEAIRAIADCVLDPSMRAFNLDQPDTTGLDAERLHALLNTPPMLAERRVVVLRAVNQLRKKSRVRDALLHYLAAPSRGTVLVMVDPAPTDSAKDKRADDFPATVTAVSMDRLAPERVQRWITHRAGQLGLVLDDAAATHLAAALASDLGTIAQELEKLAVVAIGRPATRADVEGLIGIRHGETLQDLVAAALERRSAEAARLTVPVLGQSGTSGVRVVTALGTALGHGDCRAELDRGLPPALLGTVFRHIWRFGPGTSPWRPPGMGALGTGGAPPPAPRVAAPGGGPALKGTYLREAAIVPNSCSVGPSGAGGGVTARSWTMVARHRGRSPLGCHTDGCFGARCRRPRAVGRWIRRGRPWTDSNLAPAYRLGLFRALYAANLIAADAPTVMRYLQRVVVEYDRSPWADDALLRLTQLHFAQGDPAATVQAAERMRRDYPDSPLFPRAAFPAGRAYFDLRDEARGCELIRIALGGAGDNVELRNQVSFYAARCPSAGGPTPDSGPSVRPAPARFAVQVLAVRGTAQVDEMLTRLRGMGYASRVVRDTTGFFKVWVGPYPTREEAQRVQQQLRTRLGGQPFIVEER